MKQLTPNEFIEQAQNMIFSDVPSIECCCANIENVWLKKATMTYETAMEIKEELNHIKKMVREQREYIVNVEIKE